MGDMGSLLSAISTVGFPIACAIAMAVYVKYITDKNREEVADLNAKHREEVAELNQEHKQEIAEVSKAVTNNTLVMQQLVDTINMKWGGSNVTSLIPDRDP